ncbi:MAG: gamma subclass chorismate mutase AroQ [Lysobacter sp.]
MAVAAAFAPGIAAADEASAPPAMTRLAELSAQRVLLADTVAASKRQSGRPVEDAQRERSQLEQLGVQATARGVPGEQAAAFFRAQIEANKLVQYRLLAEPSHTRKPAAAVDLGPVRQRLDGINTELLEALAPALAEAHGETCAQRAHEAQRIAARKHRLDDLHRIALARAFGDLCRMP